MIKNFIVASCLWTGLFSACAASAATIKNVDSEARTIVVTENGLRQEFAVDPNSSTTACQKSCFLKVPDGSILPLKGSESLVIENGVLRVLAE